MVISARKGVVGERLSKGLVRAETSTLKETLREHGHEVFTTLMEGIKHRFGRDSRLLPEEMRAVACALHEKAEFAYSSLFSDLVLTAPTKGRPNSGSYEMLHHWIRPVRVEGEPFHKMRLAIFAANGDRKNVEMTAHDTLVSFHEHAAHRLLQRCGSEDAAVRAIGKRLVETIILPLLALHEAPDALINTELHIPFESGLLLGSFVERQDQTLPGGYLRIHNRRVREGTLFYDTKMEFVVKTFLGSDMMNDRQVWIAYQIGKWLERYHEAATMMKRHSFHPGIPIYDSGYMSLADYNAVKADFHHLRDSVFGSLR